MTEAPSDTLWIGDLPADIDEAMAKTVFGAYGNVSRVKILPVSNSKGAAIVQFSNVEDASWIVENVNGNIAQGLPAPVVVKFAKPSGSSRGGGKGAPPPVATLGGGGAGKTPAQAAASIAAAAIAAVAGGMGPARGGAAPVGSGEWQRGGGSHPYNGKGSGKGTRLPIAEVLQELGKNGIFPIVEKSAVVQLYVSGLPMDTTDIDLYKLFSPFGCPIRPNGVKAMQKPDGSCTGVGFVDVCDPGTAQLAISKLHGLVLADGSQLRVQPKRNQPKGA